METMRNLHKYLVKYREKRAPVRGLGIILWRTDPLLGKDLETNNVTDVTWTAVAMK
jgi:hypothetical protein